MTIFKTSMIRHQESDNIRYYAIDNTKRVRIIFRTSRPEDLLPWVGGMRPWTWPGGEPIVAQPISENRQLPLAGGCNFRDLGGYATKDGRRVKWHSLYRSGAMDRLSDAHFAQLRTLGLRTICDFRSQDERTNAPTSWERLEGVRYWSRDYHHGIGDLNRLLAADTITLAGDRAVMSDIYRRLPLEQEAAYRELFAMLARGELPLLFNCSAGKDRTGLAAALVLTALGVPYDLIVEDYELSNVAFDCRASASQHGLRLSSNVIDALREPIPTISLRPGRRSARIMATR
jgi:protein-tyrosine phosphatase